MFNFFKKKNNEDNKNDTISDFIVPPKKILDKPYMMPSYNIYNVQLDNYINMNSKEICYLVLSESMKNVYKKTFDKIHSVNLHSAIKVYMNNLDNLNYKIYSVTYTLNRYYKNIIKEHQLSSCYDNNTYIVYFAVNKIEDLDESLNNYIKQLYDNYNYEIQSVSIKYNYNDNNRIFISNINIIKKELYIDKIIFVDQYKDNNFYDYTSKIKDNNLVNQKIYNIKAYYEYYERFDPLECNIKFVAPYLNFGIPDYINLINHSFERKNYNRNFKIDNIEYFGNILCNREDIDANMIFKIKLKVNYKVMFNAFTQEHEFYVLASDETHAINTIRKYQKKILHYEDDYHAIEISYIEFIARATVRI